MTMKFSPKLSHNEATEVRTALVERTRELKGVVAMQHASDEEKMDAGRHILVCEGILRREYDDYEPKSTNPS